MERLKTEFQKSFGIPFSELLLPEMPLLPLTGTVEDSLLFCSKEAAKKPFLAQADIFGEFEDSAPVGYFLVGFWGHGINSYAFYYSRVDARSKVLFRLPYGGCYMDNERMAKCIRRFLMAYFKFERRMYSMVKNVVAIESMDEGYYRLVTLEGKTSTLEKSLFKRPMFDREFRHLLG